MTVEEVVKTLHTNAGNARAIAAGLLQDVHDVVQEGKELDEIKGSMRFACVTRADVSSSSSGDCTVVDVKTDVLRSNRPKPGRSCRTSCPTLPRRRDRHNRCRCIDDVIELCAFPLIARPSSFVGPFYPAFVQDLPLTSVTPIKGLMVAFVLSFPPARLFAPLRPRRGRSDTLDHETVLDGDGWTSQQGGDGGAVRIPSCFVLQNAAES